MRLTAELIRDSLSYLNPLKERELDLRARPLRRARARQDTESPPLRTWALPAPSATSPCRRASPPCCSPATAVASIQPALPTAIPNLRHLVLASNQIAELADLDVLAKFARLTHLVLIENPVTRKENYRYWVLWRCPGVRFLDYVKVKDAERQRAVALFGTADEPTALASKIMGVKSKTFDTGAAGGTRYCRRPGAGLAPVSHQTHRQEKKRLQEMIKRADSLQEIIRLEKMLNEGDITPRRAPRC
ncbi:U2 small nuclear ribonucleoprotein A [Verticillium alfalfae VaMs.102]|uniref:U2 small nuclear ribonucleoprotein A' n=1 Tax=Verticillium alfalfae (strain VaMs.102 / ATCC MYA-4576 / FGSC 10136) TaxID=526221 RepID=C9S7T4_VERA1|nr:U2 small nuclear ribonucleoprotein A [Verticillium alfalfae VaMs.102]EEY14819.1 U2 small nuclear ribonucleoprotein A [Verticillium alfalfae VaMs.102]